MPRRAGEGAEAMHGVIERVHGGFAHRGHGDRRHRPGPVPPNLGHCDSVLAELDDLAKGGATLLRQPDQADARVDGLLKISETLIEFIAESGVETPDTPLVRAVVDTAKRITEALEAAIGRGELTLDQLLDENYRRFPAPIPSSISPTTSRSPDRLLPPIQDPLQKIDPRVVFCVAWAKGGYLPTHNPNYRQPPGKDPVWNAANCRNRRLFNDRAVAKVAANTKPFLLQTYRRDMGGGNFVLMKDLSRAIVVRGRHSGAPSAWAIARAEGQSIFRRSGSRLGVENATKPKNANPRCACAGKSRPGERAATPSGPGCPACSAGRSAGRCSPWRASSRRRKIPPAAP